MCLGNRFCSNQKNIDAFDRIARHIYKKKFEKHFTLKLYFEKCQMSPNVFEALDDARTCREKIYIVEEAFWGDIFWKMVNPIFKELQKNDDLAAALKRKGDKLREHIRYPEALRCFKLATQFACPESKIMMDIYLSSCRVALWSYKDFDGVMKVHHAARRNPHFRAYQEKYAAQISGRKDYKITPPINSRITNYFKWNLFKVHGEYPNCRQEMASCLSVQPSPTHGMGTYVNDDLEPGTTVIVEKPYVTTLNHSFKWDATNCFKCLKTISCCVPCNNCVFYVYCSMECRDMDYRDGHKYECPCLPYIYALVNLDSFHLCLKAVCRAGPTSVLNEYNKTSYNPPVRQSSGNTSEVDSENEQLQNDNKYSKVLDLCSHEASTEDLDNNVWVAYTIAQVLRHKSDFFNEYEENIRQRMTNYITSILVHHLLSFRVNAFQISTTTNGNYKVDKQSDPVQYSECESIGTGIYPTASKLNHSCDANVIMQLAPNGTIAMITNRKLVAGNQLLFSYGPTYTDTELEERQKHLKKCYQFMCACPACTLRWPTFPALKEVEKRIMCTKCSVETLKQDTEMEQYVLQVDSTGEFGTCGVCGKVHVMDLLWDEVQKHNELVNAGNVLVRYNKPLEAIPLIKMCIPFYQLTMCPPSSSLATAQRLLRKALALVTHPY